MSFFYRKSVNFGPFRVIALFWFLKPQTFRRMNTLSNSSGPVVFTEVPNYFLVRITSEQGERARRIPGRQWDGNRDHAHVPHAKR